MRDICEKKETSGGAANSWAGRFCSTVVRFAVSRGLERFPMPLFSGLIAGRAFAVAVVLSLVAPASAKSPGISVVAPTENTAPVAVYDADGSLRFSFFPYDTTYKGGVRVAVGDVNGDGFADVTTATGAGTAGHVKVFDGVSGAAIRNFIAFDPAFLGGASVAVGDVSGDGFADITGGAGAGGAPRVRVYDGQTGTVAADFFAFDAQYLGGVSVAAGDVNGDGLSDIIAGASSGSSQISVYSGDGTTDRKSVV